ncbi:MAG: Fe-S cluster assembly protein SufB [Bacilli bacterium]
MKIKGLNEDKIKQISNYKEEDEKTLNYRLNCYKTFKNLPLPNFGPEINIDFDLVNYYQTSENGLTDNWDNIKITTKEEFNELGVVSSEKDLDGIGVQYQSEVIYHNMLEELKEKKVIFTSIEEAFKNHRDLIDKYFSKIVKPEENKFTALNGAVFSGGSFIYIPKNTKLDRPLQSYFRISSKDLGQFERTLIIVDDNSFLHYIEGCTAKNYSSSNLHAAVVEIYVGKNSTCRYSTIQNWATNVYNLVTKRALVEESGTMEWIDGNIGSFKTMKYPCCILKGDNSKGTCITISCAKEGQHQDSGARMIHIGKNTTSNIISKSIASNGGKADFRGEVRIEETAENSESIVKCDTLILDKLSSSDTYPINTIKNKTSNIEHEATVSKISEEKLFYLMSRGITREEAIDLIVLGFTDRFKKELPLEYAVELNQLLKQNL